MIIITEYTNNVEPEINLSLDDRLPITAYPVGESVIYLSSQEDFMSRIAFFTCGVLVEPMEHPRLQAFWQAGGGVFGAAATSPGIVAVAAPIEENPLDKFWEWNWGEIGPYVVPRFYQAAEYRYQHPPVQTLSLWMDLESVYSFSYNGAHRDALGRRREWFRRVSYPNYVAWWVESERLPTWREACQRLEHLYDHGSTAYAFNFKHPFAVAEAADAERVVAA
jgi:hypothetical protein